MLCFCGIWPLYYVRDEVMNYLRDHSFATAMFFEEAFMWCRVQNGFSGKSALNTPQSTLVSN